MKRVCIELTRKEAQELSSWCAYLRAAPTDWEEAGGDARAVERAEKKIDRAIAAVSEAWRRFSPGRSP